MKQSLVEILEETIEALEGEDAVDQTLDEVTLSALSEVKEKAIIALRRYRNDIGDY